MENNGDTLSEVRTDISNVSGNIGGVVTGGGDIREVTITVGGQPISAKEKPTVAKLKELLAEIQQELTEVTAQVETLEKVSSDAPMIAQGTEQIVQGVAKEVEETPDVKAEEAQSLQKNLDRAIRYLGDILDGAKTVAQKASEVGQAVKPLADRLEPLIKKIEVAIFWIAKLWLSG